MAVRSIKDFPRDQRERSPIEAGPSPFPLLAMALIIALILILKLRAGEAGTMASGSDSVDEAQVESVVFNTSE